MLKYVLEELYPITKKENGLVMAASSCPYRTLPLVDLAN